MPQFCRRKEKQGMDMYSSRCIFLNCRDHVKKSLYLLKFVTNYLFWFCFTQLLDSQLHCDMIFSPNNFQEGTLFSYVSAASRQSLVKAWIHGHDGSHLIFKNSQKSCTCSFEMQYFGFCFLKKFAKYVRPCLGRQSLSTIKKNKTTFQVCLWYPVCYLVLLKVIREKTCNKAVLF